MNRAVPSFSDSAEAIVIDGVYEHYKGFRYKIVGLARHTESLEETVVYQALYGKNELWVRPLDMFLEEVIYEGRRLPRFRLISGGEIAE